MFQHPSIDPVVSQGDLGAIGADIRQLQEQSAAMSVRLKNRQAAEQRLATFLESLALPPALITTIVHVRREFCCCHLATLAPHETSHALHLVPTYNLFPS